MVHQGFYCTSPLCAWDFPLHPFYNQRSPPPPTTSPPKDMVPRTMMSSLNPTLAVSTNPDSPRILPSAAISSTPSVVFVTTASEKLTSLHLERRHETRNRVRWSEPKHLPSEAPDGTSIFFSVTFWLHPVFIGLASRAVASALSLFVLTVAASLLSVRLLWLALGASVSLLVLS